MTIRLLTDTFTVLDLVSCDRCGTTAADFLDLDEQPRFWNLDDAREYLAGWTVSTDLVLCHDCIASSVQVWDDSVAPGGMVCAVPDPTRGGICGRPVEDEPCRAHADVTEAIVSLTYEDATLLPLLRKAFIGTESPTRVLDALNRRGATLPSRLDHHLTTVAQVLRVLAQAEGNAA